MQLKAPPKGSRTVRVARPPIRGNIGLSHSFGTPIRYDGPVGGFGKLVRNRGTNSGAILEAFKNRNLPKDHMRLTEIQLSPALKTFISRMLFIKGQEMKRFFVHEINYPGTETLDVIFVVETLKKGGKPILQTVKKRTEGEHHATTAVHQRLEALLIGALARIRPFSEIP